MFNEHDTKGKKLLTKLRVGFKAQKFQHNFPETIITSCTCEYFVESITQFPF